MCERKFGEKFFQSGFLGNDLSEEMSELWVCIWDTLYHERRWRVLRQRKLTTERTVIKETLPSNGVREVGMERFSNDFRYLFIV